MKKQFIITFVVLFAIVGCTTVDDFRKMSPSERARRVCIKSPNIVNLTTQKTTLSESIRAAQIDLGRGYKVHKQCRQVKVYGQTTTTCQNFGGIVRCTEDRPESFETRCTESPVVINPELERQNIQSWSQTLIRTEQNLTTEWNYCNQWIGRMTADEAYGYY